MNDEMKQRSNHAYGMISKHGTELQKNGQTFQNYLNVLSRFSRYSVNNTILIAAQRPYAVRLKDALSWERDGFHVEENEKPVLILEPVREYKREDGSSGAKFEIKEVYDILQTDGKSTVQPETYPSLRKLVSALMDSSPVNIVPTDERKLPAYYDRKQKKIFVLTGQQHMTLFRSMAKEVSAALFDKEFKRDRMESDFQSYCTAYMLSKRYGIDTDIFSFQEMPEDMETASQKSFKKAIDEVRRVYNEIQSVMYRSLEKRTPEQER